MKLSNLWERPWDVVKGLAIGTGLIAVGVLLLPAALAGVVAGTSGAIFDVID